MVVQHHRGEGGLKAKGQCEFLTYLEHFAETNKYRGVA